MTEALAELATKEGQAVAVAADQVRLDPVRLDPVPVPVLGREREGDTPFDTPLDTPFQVRAAQHAAWVSSGDEAGGPTTRRGDESDESPSHGSSSSEILPLTLPLPLTPPLTLPLPRPRLVLV